MSNTIDNIIHRKKQQIENKAYSSKARKAIRNELAELNTIKEIHIQQIESLRIQNNHLKKYNSILEHKCLKTELILFDLLGHSKQLLSVILSWPLQDIIDMINHKSPQYWKDIENEINNHRQSYNLEPLNWAK